MRVSLPDFSRLSILVVGDVMLDIYKYHTSDRLSPEAPVPVAKETDVMVRLGGAANVALNTRRLGAKVTLVGAISDDIAGKVIRRLLSRAGIRFVGISTKGKTTKKTRVIINRRQVCRIDDEDRPDVVRAHSREIAKIVGDVCCKGVDGVVFSDYGKGVVSKETCSDVIMQKMSMCPVIVDPKGTDWDKYVGADCVKPNAGEFAEMRMTANEIITRYGILSILVTEGSDGMTLYSRVRNSVPEKINGRSVPVFDVTGAGDTVASVMCACMAGRLGLVRSAHVANVAGSIVVTKPGTATVTIDELEKEMEAYNWHSRADPVVN